MKLKRIEKMKPYKIVSHEVWQNTISRQDILKLDWNESDVNIFPELMALLLSEIDINNSHLYPPAINFKLQNLLADYAGVSNSNITSTNGSDHGLELIVRSYINPEDKVVIISPTYDNFRIYAESASDNVQLYFPENIFSTDIKNINTAVSDAKMVYLCNPNNPTGWLYSELEIEQLLSNNNNTIFIIDEAYYEFSKLTVKGLINKYSNLYITRTFSKAFALASFRIGYIISDPRNIEYINKIKNHKSLPYFAMYAAIHALSNIGKVNCHIEEVKKGEALLVDYFSKKGIKYFTTPGNFINIKLDRAIEFILKMKNQNIYVRSLAHLKGCENMVRITLGEPKTIIKLIAVIELCYEG